MNSPVIGYHGCDLKVASEVVARKAKLKPGKGRYDWLGTGVYFWEDEPNLALGWARHSAWERPGLIQTPAVIGAVIDLKYCLNLVQTGASRILCATLAPLRVVFWLGRDTTCSVAAGKEASSMISLPDERRSRPGEEIPRSFVRRRVPGLGRGVPSSRPRRGPRLRVAPRREDPPLD